jgi:pimeloyl-ACP methyl ester carboxylesterase
MTLPKPLLSRAVQLSKNLGAKGMPSAVHVTAWGTELAAAKQVIFYFGGMPASAREPALHSLLTGESDIYKSKDIHLVYIDKPGMGETPVSYSFQIRRDWPEMVRQVQEAFGIQRYSVMGVSNGGPYVMATLTHEATKEHIDSAAMIVGVSNVRAR